jgi:caffeoyl-CoA O-methyltransferase
MENNESARETHSQIHALNDRLFRYVCACGAGTARWLAGGVAGGDGRPGGHRRNANRPDQGAFLTILTAAIGARSAIEVGTFHRLQFHLHRPRLAARRPVALPGCQQGMDGHRAPLLGAAKVDGKIELRLGPAMESLKKLEAGRRFDLAFIDAHKPEYDDYYELVLPRMRANGLILFDNMLWGGRLGRQGPIGHPNGRAIDRLNRKLARDKRVESVLLSIGDGVRLCRVAGKMKRALVGRRRGLASPQPR